MTSILELSVLASVVHLPFLVDFPHMECFVYWVSRCRHLCMWSEEYCHFIWTVVSSVFQAKVTLEPNTNCREWDEVFQLADSEYSLEGLPASIIVNPKTYEVC